MEFWQNLEKKRNTDHNFPPLQNKLWGGKQQVKNVHTKPLNSIPPFSLLSNSPNTILQIALRKIKKQKILV